MNDTIKLIAINDISPNPFQPRQHFNPEELEELAQSIKQNGLIQPIIVRPSSIFGYELVAGERRLRATKMAGLSNILAVIKPMTDSESMRNAIIENLQRSDLNPIEEARSYKALIDKTKMTHEDIAVAMGKSRPYISNSLRLLNLPIQLQKALEVRQITQGHARLLLSLKETEKQILWLDEIKQKQLSVHQLEKLIKHKTKTSRKRNKSIYTIEQEERISQALGLSSKISYSKSGKGQLIIQFADDEEFHRLINKIL
ncbi:ParB/RepB/Spo0J family partition protein [Streptococcus saliviloxodontae]|uniref:ParB family chromosome partitioning protein n=1 Tax=Streptococcus saliviloxodontae TaxID=1349416 RepID=A0ABS2PM27_9STRE|nr:ParB/RepB/Spo0J family partition protein [Streptococcus saliviloxodontae]MBM7635848.1 ParB family chromosome partitioning protein [Streptococcus saliviloxodontae]